MKEYSNTIRLTKEEADFLKRIAEEECTSISQVMRWAIRDLRKKIEGGADDGINR